MHEHRFHGGVAQLRSPARVARLEVERVVELALEDLPAHTVLDVGTGTGLFAEAFIRRGLQVTGIDDNPDMLEEARALVPDAEFRQAIAEDIPFEDHAFDLVFLGLVLHETDDPARAMQEIFRASTRRAALLEFRYQVEEFGPGLEERLSPKRVNDLAAQAGFTRVEALPLEHLVLYRLSKDSQ